MKHRSIAALVALAAAAAPSILVATASPAAADESRVQPVGAVAALGEPGADLNQPAVDLVATPSGAGYWVASADGGVFAYGDARFLGSAGATPLNQPVVGMAATPSGSGYWLVAADGGIFSFGDAPFLGSAGNVDLNADIIGMAATPTGKGYWIGAADGGVFAFGDATFAGSAGGTRLNQPIVGIGSQRTGSGYWLVASDGGVFNFGGAPFKGSTGDMQLNAPIADITSSPSGQGYWMVGEDGGIFAFGDAPHHGSAVDRGVGPAVAIDANLDGTGSWVITDKRDMVGRDLGLFTATCYALRGTTASGRPAGPDVIAVDPRLIPLGTEVIVEGLGRKAAGDTGGDIKGRRIDVWRSSTAECRSFGRQSLRVFTAP
jgi:3D (Asp-Asp-Asp) domain-containing protein